jgi:hypothetical protein
MRFCESLSDKIQLTTQKSLTQLSLNSSTLQFNLFYEKATIKVSNQQQESTSLMADSVEKNLHSEPKAPMCFVVSIFFFQVNSRFIVRYQSNFTGELASDNTHLFRSYFCVVMKGC